MQQVKGLFINCKKAKDSIFESGWMVYQCLLLSRNISWDYCEIDADNRSIDRGYGLYFFNYHPVTMGWLETSSLKKNLGTVFTMILEVSPGDAFVMCPENDFSYYCVLDPTIISRRRNVFTFPRPLEKINTPLTDPKNEIPVIGTFGFATKGKGFQHVVEAVNKEFEKAIVKINIPYGDFVPESASYAAFLGDVCKKKAKPGVEVRVTHDFMSKVDLIQWCASNTLNCFLYDRQMPGLAATTDQAIVSGRPLSVSDNDTFRHITAYLPPYPAFSLKDSIEKSTAIVQKINTDWSPENFARKFDDILEQIHFSISMLHSGPLTLSLKKISFNHKLSGRIKKYKRKLRPSILKKNIVNIFKAKHDII